MNSETVAQSFDSAAARWRERPFLHVLDETAGVYGIAPGTITYGDAAAAVERLRARYAAAGYGAGERVGLMLENRPAFFLHWLALNGVGASVVPLNPELRPAELDYLVAHSEIALAVGTASHLAPLREAAARTGRNFAVAADADGAIAAPAGPPARRGEATECALLYTSGTTGRPKGCIVTNAYFLRCGRWYNAIGGLARLASGTERLLTPLPMVHMNAMACSTMAMILAGGCIIPLDRFHPRSWWQSVRESGATIVHYLGIMPSLLLTAEPDPLDRAHRVRFGFGAGVDRRHHAAFEARFGFPLLEGWAMTETGAGAVIIANREPRHVGTNCFGKPEPAVETRLVDEDGRDVEVDRPGELLVRAAGPDPRAGFFAAYLKDDAATEAAWRGGWFHTGDIVRRDDAGFHYFIDRRKNIIRRSGENISAVEVETVLRRHPAVREVAVAAAPDDLRGEEVLACVVPRAPIAPDRLAETARSIVALALGDLAYYKVPGWVAFLDELPLTATQKVQRALLKDRARELPGTSCCIDTRPLKRRRS
jgi:acyl-CoA synthetase (AMP-forming)/AMP-acid ligase II